MRATTRTVLKAVVLYGAGVLLLFIGYVGWEYQVCNDLNRRGGLSTICGSFDYPFRSTGLFFGALGVTLIILAVVVLPRLDAISGKTIAGLSYSDQACNDPFAWALGSTNCTESSVRAILEFSNVSGCFFRTLPR